MEGILGRVQVYLWGSISEIETYSLIGPDLHHCSRQINFRMGIESLLWSSAFTLWFSQKFCSCASYAWSRVDWCIGSDGKDRSLKWGKGCIGAKRASELKVRTIGKSYASIYFWENEVAFLALGRKQQISSRFNQNFRRDVEIGLYSLVESLEGKCYS